MNITKRLLQTDEKGTIRIANTRVPLETVIEAYQEGLSPEAILESYPALDLADIYEVIAHYLRHTDEVEAYLRESELLSNQAVEDIRARLDHDAIHAQFLERQQKQRDS